MTSGFTIDFSPPFPLADARLRSIGQLPKIWSIFGCCSTKFAALCLHDRETPRKFIGLPVSTCLRLFRLQVHASGQLDGPLDQNRRCITPITVLPFKPFGKVVVHLLGTREQDTKVWKIRLQVHAFGQLGGFRELKIEVVVPSFTDSLPLPRLRVIRTGS